MARVMPSGAEALIGPTIDLQGASFLTEGAQIRRAVAYIEVNDAHSSKVGSGFLVSPRLFLTNCHVIGDANAARSSQIVFDREMDETGAPRPTTIYLLDPDTFALFSQEKEFDYALIAVGRLNAGSARIEDLGYCVLSDGDDKHAIGMNVTVIQHPRGLPKMIWVRNNPLTHRTKRTLLYETDTEQGSSGAPVFNDEWDLVALHHWGQPWLEHTDDQGKTIPSNVNEGVRISALYRDLQSRLASLPAPQQELLSAALAYAHQARSTSSPGRVLSPPRPRAAMHESMSRINERETAMTDPSDVNELRVTIPIEVTIRLGSSSLADAAIVAPFSQVPDRNLSRGAEAVRIDRDYENRSGYDPTFIPGIKLPLPTLGASLTKQIAPLRGNEAGAASGLLKYEHFSLVMNKKTRLAIFTATNIDGEEYLTIDRKTGEVAASEGETWYKDDRISASYFLDQSFYSSWSTYFDRGHLTRRTDPTWGTKPEAERANADTFHFTNCSPQHFRFNQTTKYWQGAERHVLENGVLAADTKKRVSVFQGPIFDDAIDHWADDVQIPSSFFKIIAWKGAKGLKSVGLIVDQLPLLSESRKNLGSPREAAAIDVSQWRVPIGEIEQRTGLTFDKAIRDADTFGAQAQPAVGAERRVLLRSLDGILA
jgi:endonuclease G